MRATVQGTQPHAQGDEPQLSVVIPAYNEEQHITTTLETLMGFLERWAKWPYEIIVVDDGSTDATAELVERFSQNGCPVRLLRGERNCGKGCAVRRGMLHARGAYRFFIDADLSYPVEDIDTMLAQLQDGYDIVIGSRALAGSHMEVRPPLRRYLAGRVYSLLIQAFLMQGIPDTQCGFKGFGHDAAEKLFSRLTLDGWAFDVELLFLARKFGYRLQMIPVRLTFAKDTSKVRLFSHSLQMFLDLLRIRLNDARGIYG